MYTNPPKCLLGEGFQVFGYCRVSTKDQETNWSLETQEKQIREYARLQGWKVAHIFFDVGSGADLVDRPEYRSMLKRLHKADIVIAARLDRLGRNTREILSLIDQTENRLTGLLALDLSVNPHEPMGRLVWGIMAQVAEFERMLILSRTSQGRQAKAIDGGYAFGAPPFGYTVIAGELVQVPEEQRVIKIVEKYRALKYSLRDIGRKLSELGHKTKRGGAWHPSIISKILKRFKK